MIEHPRLLLEELHNIFCKDVSAALRDSLRVGAGWRRVQIADLIAQYRRLGIDFSKC